MRKFEVVYESMFNHHSNRFSIMAFNEEEAVLKTITHPFNIDHFFKAVVEV